MGTSQGFAGEKPGEGDLRGVGVLASGDGAEQIDLAQWAVGNEAACTSGR